MYRRIYRRKILTFSSQTSLSWYFPCLQVDLIIGEPVFQTSLLPWDNVYFWYAANELSNQIKEKAKVLPCSKTIYAVAVNYLDLWKIRADVGMCEGFDIGHFDKLIQVSWNLGLYPLSDLTLNIRTCGSQVCHNLIQVISLELPRRH